jgi:hypothetical protein
MTETPAYDYPHRDLPVDQQLALRTFPHRPEQPSR